MLLPKTPNKIAYEMSNRPNQPSTSQIQHDLAKQNNREVANGSSAVVGAINQAKQEAELARRETQTALNAADAFALNSINTMQVNAGPEGIREKVELAQFAEQNPEIISELIG